MKLYLAVISLLCACATGYSAKILAIFPAPSHSHQVVYRNLMVELNKRGHDMTVMTPDPIGDANMTNYREIDVGYSYDYWKKKFDFSSDSNQLLRWFPEIFLLAMIDTLQDLCNMYLSDPQMIKILEENEKFDLLFVEWGIAPCMYPYLKQSDGKMVGIISLSLGSIGQMSLGSTSNPAYVPEVGFPYTDHMAFHERLRTTIFQSAAYAFCKFILWDHDKIVRKYFGPDTRSLFEIEREVSLVFTNTHFSTLFPRPNSPNVIPIGGPAFHLLGQKTKPLPKVSLASLASGTRDDLGQTGRKLMRIGFANVRASA